MYKSLTTRIAALCLSLAFAASSAVFAQDFPTRPITFILSSGSGSSVDVMARVLAHEAEGILGQPIGVVNRTGGSGAVAMSDLLSRPADGYNIWAATKTFPVAMNTTLKQFSMGDFQPLVRVQIDPFAIAVRSDAPWQTLDELLAAANQRPGEITIGGFGAASPHALLAYVLMDRTDTDFIWVPFEAGNDATTAVLGGHVDAVISNPSTLKQFVDAGNLTMLAIASEERLGDFPDTPTFRDQGLDIVDSQWRGIFVKAGTPESVMTTLDDAFRAAIASDGFQDYLTRTNQLDGYMGPEAFGAFVAQEMESVREVVEKVGFGQ